MESRSQKSKTECYTITTGFLSGGKQFLIWKFIGREIERIVRLEHNTDPHGELPSLLQLVSETVSC